MEFNRFFFDGVQHMLFIVFIFTIKNSRFLVKMEKITFETVDTRELHTGTDETSLYQLASDESVTSSNRSFDTVSFRIPNLTFYLILIL